VSPSLFFYLKERNPIPLERNQKMDFSAINNNNTNNNNARPRSSSGIGGAGSHNNLMATTTTTRNRQITNVYGQGYQHDFARHNRSGATPPSFLHQQQQQRTRPSSAGLNLFGGGGGGGSKPATLPPLSSSNNINNNNNNSFSAMGGSKKQTNNNNNNTHQKLQAATQLKISGYVPPLSSFINTTTVRDEETGELTTVLADAQNNNNNNSNNSPTSNSMLATAAGTGKSIQQLKHHSQEQFKLNQQLSVEERRAQEAKAADERRRQEIDHQAVVQAYEKTKQHLMRLWSEANIPEDERSVFRNTVWATVPDSSSSVAEGSNSNIIGDPSASSSAIISATSKTLEEIEKLLQIRDSEIRVEKSIEIRQGFLYLLQELSDRFNTGKVERDTARKELVAVVPSLRKATCDVIEAIEQWSGISATKLAFGGSSNNNSSSQQQQQQHQRQMKQQQLAMNYLWRGANYCEKMLTDTGFLGTSRIRMILDFEPTHNPLLRGPKMFVGINRREASALQDRVLKAAAFLNAVAEWVGVHGSSNSKTGVSSSSSASQQQQKQSQSQQQQRSALLPNPNQQQQQRPSSLFDASDDNDDNINNKKNNTSTTNRGRSTTSTNLQQQSSVDIIHGFGIAASRIQALFRGFQGRCHYRRLKRENAAAEVIQRAARKFIAKCITNRLRDRYRAAIKIQALFRGNHVRDEIRHDMMKNRCATDIQRVFRGYVTRKRVRAVRFVVDRAVSIQKVYRGFRVRKTVESVMHHRLAYAATLIQSIFRGYRVRCQPRYNHRIVPQVIKIQSLFRGCLARIRYRNVLGCVHAATRIQAWFRGVQVRSQMQHLRLAISQRAFETLKRTEEKAAVCIQRIARGFITRIKYPPSAWRKATEERQRESIVQLAKREERVAQQRRLESAILIQKVWRGSYARHALPFALMTVRSAIKIQALVRGFLARQEYKRSLFAMQVPMSEDENGMPTFSVTDLLRKYGRDDEYQVDNNDEQPQPHQHPQESLLVSERDESIQRYNNSYDTNSSHHHHHSHQNHHTYHRHQEYNNYNHHRVSTNNNDDQEHHQQQHNNDSDSDDTQQQNDNDSKDGIHFY